MDRCPNCGWTDRALPRNDRDFRSRGMDLERGFAGHDHYDRERNRYRDDDRYRYSSGDPYFDRGYDRPRDDSDWRFRDRADWDDYPWNRY